MHPGQMATLELSFSPQCVEPYEGRLLVEYLGGEKTVATVLLRGVAEDVDVHLSTNNLQLEPAYVHYQFTEDVQGAERLRNSRDLLLEAVPG